MQSSSDLLVNEFHILKAQYSSSAVEISDLLEDAEFEDVIPQDILLKAQQTLVTPRDRLFAELSWLPELSHHQMAEVVQIISDNDTNQAWGKTDHFPELAKANILAHCASRSEGAASLILSLSLCWDDINSSTLTEFINENRKNAGFPKATSLQVDDALAALCLRHAVTAADSIWRSGVPGFLMNSIVEKELTRRKEATFLKNLVRQHDKNSERDLDDIAEKIREAAEKAKVSDDYLESHIQDIGGLLFQWDEINQPVQLYDQSRGHEEPRSKALYQDLRELSINLANNHNRFDAALQLSEALLRTFPELEAVAETLRGDVTDLEDLVEQEKDNRILQPLFEACEAAKNTPRSPIRSTLRSEGFSENAQGVIGRIAEAFTQANATKSDPSVLYLVVRDLGLYWNNDKDDPETAFLLINALISLADDSVPGNIFEKLKEDRSTLHKNWKMNDLEANKSNAVVMQRILDELGIYANDDEKREYAQIKSEMQRRKYKQYIKWGIIAAIGVFIFFATREEDNNNRSRSTTYNSSNSSNSDPSGPSLSTRKPVSAFDETVPVVASGLSLSESQLRYCIYQSKRLEFMRNLTENNTEIELFNGMVDDWNARCSSYRYYPATLSKIQNEVENKSYELQQDARRILGK